MGKNKMTDTPETDELSKGEHIAHPTVWSFCRKFERERNDAIEMMKRTKDNSGQIISLQANENILLTEQRDRIANVLHNIRSGYGGQIPDPDCHCGDCEFLIKIDTALQFLTPNEP